MKKIMVIFLLITLTTGCLETTEVKEKEESEVYPTFEITAGTNLSTAYINFNKKENSFVIPIIIWSTSHTIRDVNNNAWITPELQFAVSLIAGNKTKAQDTESVYFSVGNLDEIIESEVGDFRFITRSRGSYHATWGCDSDVWYEEGSKDLTIMHPETISLDFEVNQAGISYMHAFDMKTFPITFSNVRNTWNESYNITFVVVQELNL